MAAQKKSVKPVCRKARGQFPNNPAGWSYLEARGALRLTTAAVSRIRFGGVISLSTSRAWGRGVFG